MALVKMIENTYTQKDNLCFLSKGHINQYMFKRSQINHLKTAITITM